MENKKLVKSFLIFIALAFTLYNVVFAQTSPWRVKADKILFNWETQYFEADGNVEFSGKDILVKATHIEGNVKEGIFKAEGDVLFKDKNGEFNAEFLEYFYKDEKAIIKSVKLTYPVPESKEKMYIKGTEVLWQKGNINLKKGNFTTCSYDNPHYYMSSSQIEYYPNDRVVFINVVFFLRFPYPYIYIPIFYVPYYVLPLTKEPSPFPQIGYNSELGIYFSYPFTYSLWGVPGIITFLISQNQGVKFTLNQKYEFPNLSGSVVSSYLYNYIYNTDEFRFSLSGIYKPFSNLSLNFNTSYLLYPYSQNYSLQASTQLTYTSDVLKTNVQSNWNKTALQDALNTSLNSSIKLSERTNIQANVRYSRIDYLTGTDREDIQGNIKFEFNDKDQNFSIYANQRWTNTSDFLLKKVPEIYYGRNLKFGDVPTKIEFLLGNYIEPSIPFAIKTWKFGYYLSLFPQFKLPFGNINANLGYKQEFYGTQDARYVIYANISSNYRISSILSGSINYNLQWLGNDIFTGDSGNSPFYFDYLSNIHNLSLSTNIGNPNLRLSLQESYNFLTKSISPLSISGYVRWGNVLSLNMRTSYIWTSQKFSSIFLQGLMQYPWLSFSFGSLYDVNTNTLQRLDYRMLLKITGDWHFAGNISLTGYYLPTTGNVLYSLTLDKDLHCFNAKLVYYFPSKSFQFSLSLKAFPTKGIEFIGRPEGFSLLPSF